MFIYMYVRHATFFLLCVAELGRGHSRGTVPDQPDTNQQERHGVCSDWQQLQAHPGVECRGARHGHKVGKRKRERDREGDRERERGEGKRQRERDRERQREGEGGRKREGGREGEGERGREREIPLLAFLNISAQLIAFVLVVLLFSDGSSSPTTMTLALGWFSGKEAKIPFWSAPLKCIRVIPAESFFST